MKNISLTLFLFCISEFAFSQDNAIYMKITSEKLRPQNLLCYYNCCNKIYQSPLSIPSNIFLPIKILCDTCTTISLIYDFHNFKIDPISLTGDLVYHRGDSILLDFDRKIVTIINKKVNR